MSEVCKVMLPGGEVHDVDVSPGPRVHETPRFQLRMFVMKHGVRGGCPNNAVRKAARAGDWYRAAFLWGSHERRLYG